jgi:K(+)-stimulated pyrophosphate-energized sodium pump
LLTAYSEATTVKSLDIRDARVMAGLLMGGALPALLSSMTLNTVGRTAGLRLLRYGVSSERFPDFEGKVRPDYQRRIDIAASGALGQLLVPCLVAVASP